MTFENIAAIIIAVFLLMIVLSNSPSQQMKPVEAEVPSCASRTTAPRSNSNVEEHIAAEKVNEKMLLEKKERVMSSINEGLHMIDMELDRNSEHF